jgi:uncharacterized protein (TIGR00299 family) protein
MKIVYLETNMGAAGDMLLAALYELLPEREAVLAELNALSLPGIEFVAERAEKHGIVGTHMRVRVMGQEEESVDVPPAPPQTEKALPRFAARPRARHDHPHEHEHPHSHEHGLGGLAEIRALIEGLPVPAKVKADALAVYGLIAEAESAAHGREIDQVHFHEVGTLDAVADVVGACLLFAKVGAEKVVCSPVHVGFGAVRTAHGVLPVPAPATAHILRGVPSYSDGVRGELCTPTGAALLKHFANDFGGMPPMAVEAIGYGMGTKDFERANCVRAFLGEGRGAAKTVVEIECNIDDMTGEALGFAQNLLLEEGALDVTFTAIQMKKNRPGVKLSLLCREGEEDRFAALLLRHTSTRGLRWQTLKRAVMDFEEGVVETPLGPLREKRSIGYGAEKSKIEFDDLAALAKKTGLSLYELQRALERGKADPN